MQHKYSKIILTGTLFLVAPVNVYAQANDVTGNVSWDATVSRNEIVVKICPSSWPVGFYENVAFDLIFYNSNGKKMFSEDCKSPKAAIYHSGQCYKIRLAKPQGVAKVCGGVLTYDFSCIDAGSSGGIAPAVNPP